MHDMKNDYVLGRAAVQEGQILRAGSASRDGPVREYGISVPVK